MTEGFYCGTSNETVNEYKEHGVDRQFRQMLKERQEKINSLVCVGLDPLLEKLPEDVSQRSGTWHDVYVWMKEIVDATAPFASMFKPQRAHWEALHQGELALRTLIEYIHSKYPDIPVFLDCKRGDIDRTQQQYRQAHFKLDGADGMNYNGYMGKDTLRALVDTNHMGRALVGLGRTSNPEAWEIQDRLLGEGRRMGGFSLWEFMVDRICEWSREFGVLDNAGVVMGAAHKNPHNPEMISSRHLRIARQIAGNNLWFLIPGIGKQGGAVEQTVKAAYMGTGSIAINSSSDIIFASSEADFATAAGRAAEKLRDEINQYR